jgi:hypothetical protein
LKTAQAKTPSSVNFGNQGLPGQQNIPILSRPWERPPTSPRQLIWNAARRAGRLMPLRPMRRA